MELIFTPNLAGAGRDIGVVSIGTNPTFKVKFTPNEYVPTMSKRLHFFNSGFLPFKYTLSINVSYLLRKKSSNKPTLATSLVSAYSFVISRLTMGMDREPTINVTVFPYETSLGTNVNYHFGTLDLVLRPIPKIYLEDVTNHQLIFQQRCGGVTTISKGKQLWSCDYGRPKKLFLWGVVGGWGAGGGGFFFLLNN